jgi:hypothetical protein
MATRKRSSGTKLRFLISIARLVLLAGMLWILVKVLAMFVRRRCASLEGHDDTPSLLPASSVPEQAPPADPPAPERDFLATGVWRCPDGLSGASYVGSVASDVFHTPECISVSRIATRTRVCYESREATVEYGKRPCEQCTP